MAATSIKRNVFFIGGAGAGKTYSAKYLVDMYGYKLAKFAYPVYMIAEKYFDMGTKDRDLLQKIGTEGGRALQPTIWIDRLLQDVAIAQKIQLMRNPDEPLSFVIDDCRFINEMDALLKADWVGVYLECPLDIRLERLKRRDGYDQSQFMNHQSETELINHIEDLLKKDEFKNYKLYKIDSSSSLEDMYKSIDELAAPLIK